MICVYFNPRSHERSDETYKTLYISDLISIHAPTRGATILCNHRGLVFGFQSTLPREERRDNMKVIAEIEKFQSTLPREERLSSQARLIWWHQHFNPRSHERSDDKNHSGAVDNAEFQSTLPREERLLT